MTIYFENEETFALGVLQLARDQFRYRIELDPSQYIAYAYPNQPEASGGLYSEAVPCGLTAGCTDHSPLVFQVEAGQTVAGIDICDWSSPEHVPANPAPFDPRLAGMAYQLNGLNYFRYEDGGQAQLLMSTPFNLEGFFFRIFARWKARGLQGWRSE